MFQFFSICRVVHDVTVICLLPFKQQREIRNVPLSRWSLQTTQLQEKGDVPAGGQLHRGVRFQEGAAEKRVRPMGVYLLPHRTVYLLRLYTNSFASIYFRESSINITARGISVDLFIFRQLT